MASSIQTATSTLDQGSFNNAYKRTTRLSSLSMMKQKLVVSDNMSVSSSVFKGDEESLASSNNGNDTYQLVRMSTGTSMDSNFTMESLYQVTLSLSKKEIELLRYTWNKMILEEPILEKKSVLPIPGDYKLSTQKERMQSGKSGSSSIASSLFCKQLYSNLLLAKPELEILFPSIKHQATAFAGVLSLTMSQLENLSILDDYLLKLGKTHARVLNIEAVNFELMGEALIQTFNERFGAKFTKEIEILWIKVYLFLANSILQAGLDPIMKFDETKSEYVYENQDLGSQSELSKSSTLSSMQEFNSVANSDSNRRTSVQTNMTSAPSSFTMPAIKNATSIRKPTPTAAAPKEEKRRLFKNKKKDCVIM